MRRRGAAVVEAAIVLPVMMLLLLGIVVGGLGVFHHQQVACLAQEAARFASLRGADHCGDHNCSSPTTQDIVERTIYPLAVTMDKQLLSVTIEWIDQSTGTAVPWDEAPKDVKSPDASGAYVTNTVRVTVRYAWKPIVIFSPHTLASTAEVMMQN